MTEDALQSAIVATLRLCGAEVLITSRRRKKCVYCGRWPVGGDGVTKGTPDLFVWRQGWGLSLRGIEVKGPDTAVSPEQRRLADLGAITVVRTVEEALAAVGIDPAALRMKGARLP